MANATITPSDNGPYLVQGSATVLDAEGNQYQVTDTIAVCRCGHSSTKPFCDGTHEKANFAAVNRAASRSTPMRFQPSPADKTAGEGEEAFVDVFAAVGANEKAAAVTEPGEGALDDPTVAAESGAVLGLASRDHGFDAAFPGQTAVLVVVVAAVGDQRLGSTPRAPVRPRTGGTRSSNSTN